MDAQALSPRRRADPVRSLTATMCLCQALFVALAYKLELTVEETRDHGEYDD